MSLFSTFYRHWRTEDRSALETFLTHTLAYILDSLTQLEADAMQRFVPDVLLAAKTPGPDSHRSLKKLKGRLSSNLRWVSEDRISVKDGSKRPDLCLYSGSEPVVVIEAKVSAPLADGQLETYGKWLASKYPSDLTPGAALLFLTHSTTPPGDFLDAEARAQYGVPLRAVSSWMEIHNFLLSGLHLKNQFLTGLAEEFCKFMAELKLNGMTAKDALSLHKLLAEGVGPKIEPLFEMVRQHLRPLFGKAYTFEKDLNLWDTTEGCAIWDWCYRKGQYWYIGWGLMVGVDFFGVGLPNSLQAFVAFQRDPQGNRFPFDSLPNQYKVELQKLRWKFFRGPEVSNLDLWIKFTDAQVMAQQPGGLTQPLIRWFETGVVEAIEILKRSEALIGKK